MAIEDSTFEEAMLRFLEAADRATSSFDRVGQGLREVSTSLDRIADAIRHADEDRTKRPRTEY